MGTPSTPGISGLSLSVPRYRVSLEQWAKWVGAPSDKIEAVVGRGFRVCGPGASVYTMAADAVLDLIRRYDVDPRDVGMLAFGTESSTDNAAGAVVIRGMVDDALRQLGRPTLHRSCEVPELKHACLGGVYGMKAATRYLAHDGRSRRAIVVSADIAEYERGSTGEQTQGAGAVAMLLDADPQLCHVDLAGSGNASAYRGVDFRKPFARHRVDGYAAKTQRLHDFPIFNGKYSTLCYLDATLRALESMFERTGESPSAFLDRVAAVVCHRPYHHMPVQAMATALVWVLAREADRDALADLCAEADVDIDTLRQEVQEPPDLFAGLTREGVAVEPFPGLVRLARHYRKTPAFKQFVAQRMSLGSQIVRDLGNLYTAALPAWLGAALQDAAERPEELAGQTILALGYGSGDAAEAIPLQVAPGWRAAAAKLGFAEALEGAIDLDRAQYEALHDAGAEPQTGASPRGFVVDRVGDRYDPEFQDLGIEYYRWVG
ncbi:MAG: hydroxymethylglutaryl-CoA synthase [Myxococcota bacterium]